MNLLNRRRMMFSLLGGGGLPDGYQELQWVASNGVGGNVVDTLISAPSGVFVVGRVSFQNVSGYQVNGAEDVYPYARNYPIGVSSGGQWYLGADGYWTSGSVVWGQAYDIEASTLIGDIHLNVDGVSVIRQTAGNDRSAKNLYLFGSNGYNNVTKMTIYGHLFYYADSDRSNLIAEFVPCKRKSDDAVGLYDIKRGIFLLPASVALTAGPDVGVYSDGVYVQSYDGKLYTNEQWDRTQPAKGIALLYNDVRIVIRKSYSDALSINMAVTGYDWDNALLVDGITATQDLVARIKQNSVWGGKDWQGAYDSLAAEGGVPYIPSINEVNAIYTNRAAIDQLISLIGGVAWARAYSSIGSNQYSSKTLWVNNNGSWVVQYPDNKNRIYLIERYV